MVFLFVTHYAGFYGANKSMLTLILMLREKYGIQPLVLLPSEGQMCRELKKGCIKYFVSHYYWWVNYNHGFYQWLLNKRKQLINMRRIRGLCDLFKYYKIDLVYTNSICVNIGYLIAKRMNVPHIWHFRESLKQFSIKFSLSLFLSKRILFDEVNKRYILISDYMMTYYKRYLPCNRMVKLYNGVDLPHDVSRMEANRLYSRLQIACVGVVSEQKNQMELLKALTLLKKEGIIVDIWLIGAAKAEYTSIIKKYIKENNMDDMVHIVGHTDNVFDLLKHMNLGVVSAQDEAFGRVTIEYMLMQMPVVVSDSGANAELVEPGVTGEIYKSGNVVDLAKAIKHYIDYPELLEKQGLLAECKAKTEFSAEQNADLVYKQIENVLNN